jgi:hypothetical protein
MDLEVTEKGRLRGTNGVLQTILQAVITDPRWRIETVETSYETTEIALCFTDNSSGKMAGSVTIAIKEY